MSLTTISIYTIVIVLTIALAVGYYVVWWAGLITGIVLTIIIVILSLAVYYKFREMLGAFKLS